MLQNKYLLSAIMLSGALFLANCSREKPAKDGVPVGEPINVTGKELYEHTACIVCHGKTGMADGQASAHLKPNATNFTDKAHYKHGSSKEEILKTISNGVPGTAMASYAYLHESDRVKLAEYILSFQK